MKVKKEGHLQVVSISDLSEHNHPLSDAVFSFYREVRRLTGEEKKLALEMLEARIPPRVIASTINSNRKLSGKKGIVLSKDISNLVVKNVNNLAENVIVQNSEI